MLDRHLSVQAVTFTPFVQDSHPQTADTDSTHAEYNGLSSNNGQSYYSEGFVVTKVPCNVTSFSTIGYGLLTYNYRECATLTDYTDAEN